MESIDFVVLLIILLFLHFLKMFMTLGELFIFISFSLVDFHYYFILLKVLVIILKLVSQKLIN